MNRLRKSSKPVGFSLICCFLLGSLAPLAALIDPNPSCAMACARTSRCCCKKKPVGDSATPAWAAARACGDACRQVALWLPLSIGMLLLLVTTPTRLPRRGTRWIGRSVPAPVWAGEYALSPRPPPVPVR